MASLRELLERTLAPACVSDANYMYRFHFTDFKFVINV